MVEISILGINGNDRPGMAYKVSRTMDAVHDSLTNISTELEMNIVEDLQLGGKKT